MAASEPNPGQRSPSTDEAMPPDRGSLNPVPSGVSAQSGSSAAAVPAKHHGGAFRLLTRTFESLSNRDYRWLWIGMMTGMSGTQMQMLARGILVYDITGSYALTGIVSVGFAPAMIFGSILSGTVTERIERRALIQLTQLGQVVLALSIGLLVFADMIIWQHILVASIIQGLMFAFMMPARQVVIPKIVGKRLMSNAMSLNSAAMSFTAMAAPAVGGILYAVIGPDGVYFVVAGLNLVAIGMTGLLPKFPPDPNAPRRSIISNTAEGFRYVRQNRTLMSVIAFVALGTILSMPFRMLLPAISSDVFDASEFETGVLVAMMGLGSLIGALAIAALRQGQRRGIVLMASAFVSAFGLVVFASLPYYWVGIFIMLFMGIGEAGRFALGQALSMEETDDEHRARVASLFQMTFGLMPLGILPVSLAMEVYGAEPTLFVLGLILFATSVISLGFMKKLRQLG
ncbi:MAG: MFS transporter [Chloroflexi bacterium]|jgi:MFS family permease|nr:MFS transporter [Chloroflexota bacterium]MBT4074605.1 MFS transporter [Chloroflexota bacterium]MBT4513875.1 MFS transporter [Chloroflexota bacterium]MBT6682217.1 MFS transporter [Chloroflexota bacterium]